MSRLESALRAARDTKRLAIGRGVIAQTPAVFRELFGAKAAVVVSDPQTHAAAGEKIARSLGCEVITLPVELLDILPLSVLGRSMT
jgi:glycerol dehydrogenase-like iron-containing ADH family enzyme